LRQDYESLSKEALVEILRRRDAQARYGLIWEREEIPAEKALNRDFVGLELDRESSCGEAPHGNLIIEGDNYDALRLLVSTMAGQFQLIYVDPPYNTGRRDFVYNDRYFDATNRFRHSTWLEFMYQRLILARDLLADDGVIFISIDDNELFNLGLLMNQVFGENSFVANCIWQKRYSRENREAIGDAHEYLLAYSPNRDKFKVRRGRLPLTEEQAKIYKCPGNPKEKDPTKRWRGIPLTAQGFRPNQMYTVVAPGGKPHPPPEGRCWSLLEPEFHRLNAEGRIYWGKDNNSQPSEIRYLSEVEGMVPWTWWTHEEVGHTDEARKEVQALFGTQTAFDTPKPLRLMRRVLDIGAPEKDALVLDFFAGSGTLGHAVLEMNKADGGNRRFVLVSNRESTDEAPDKNLCRDICAGRLRRAVEGYKGKDGGAVAPLGGSFAYARAVRVPMHRLEHQLTNDLVWSHALLMAGHPLVPYEGPVAKSVRDEQMLLYCANTKPATMKKLGEALQEHRGPAAVFTWAPAVITALAEELDRPLTVVAVPEDLRRTFRQGKARVVDNDNAVEEAA
jgi:adenine-specific DNA-methyltransferase